MAGTLVQKLYLGGLPPGLNMTITNVKASKPNDKKWGAQFDRYDVGHVAINQYGSYDTLSGKYPISVATSSSVNGLIGVVAFEGYSPFYSTGTGGKVDISIRIQGTTNVNGNTYTVDQKGYITVSATDWKWVARPDYLNISYYWGDTAPESLSISVPPTIAGQPDDAYFVFGVSADGKQIGANTTLHKEILAEVTDYLIRGIFFGNEKLVGWAVGKV